MHPEQIAQLAYHHQANLLAEARAVQQAPARRRLALFRHHRRPARPARPVGPEC